MTACSSRLQWLGYKTESTWGENVATMTTPFVVPHNGMIDLTNFSPVMIDSPRAVQWKNEQHRGVPGPFGTDASFTFEMDLFGAEGATTGAVTLTDMTNLLGYVIGAVTAGGAGTTASGTGSTTSITTTSSATFSAGQMGRAGAAGDGKGNGQWFAATSHVTTTLTVKNAMQAATASTDVVYGAATISTAETTCTFAYPGGALQSLRYQIQTADGQFLCHGCYPKAVSFSGLMPGEVPKASITMGVSWVEMVAVTWPNATAATTSRAVPVGAAEVQLQVYGTTTRNVIACRSLAINFTLGVMPIIGYNSVNALQTCVGATRTQDTCTIDLVIDGVGTASTWWDAFQTNAAYHLIAGLSTAATTAVGFYFPRLLWTGKRPTQIDGGGLNRIALQFKAVTDNLITTTDLTAAMMKIGFS